MKINLMNTPHGLVPMYDEDFDEKKKLKIGQVYTADLKIPRNYDFLKKFFALINAGYSLLPEKTQQGFRSVEGFRQYVTVAAGYYDVYFNPRLKEFVEVPKSISFASMDESEFMDCYDAVKEVIWKIIGDRVTEEVFENVLANF